MVKATIKTASAVKKPKMDFATLKATLLSKVQTDVKFRTLALQNTANRWAERASFNGDLDYKGLSETKKSFHLSVDGKPLKSKYLITGTIEKPFFISGNAIARATRQ